jgi:hypothetical protein
LDRSFVSLGDNVDNRNESCDETDTNNAENHGMVEAVPWLRWLVSGLSPQRPWLAVSSEHVGFVVDKVVL